MESEAHKEIKKIGKGILKNEMGFSEEEIQEEYVTDDYPTGENNYRFDLVGENDEKRVVIECGILNGNIEKKKEYIRKNFDLFLHLPYVSPKAKKWRENIPTLKEKLIDFLEEFSGEHLSLSEIKEESDRGPQTVTKYIQILETIDVVNYDGLRYVFPDKVENEEIPELGGVY